MELPLHQLREDLDRLEVPATEVVNGRGKNSEYLPENVMFCSRFRTQRSNVDSIERCILIN